MILLLTTLLWAASTINDAKIKTTTTNEKKVDKTQVDAQKKEERVIISKRDLKEVLAKYPGGTVTRAEILPHLVAIGIDVNTPRPIRLVNEMEMQAAAYIAFINYILPLAKKTGIEKEKQDLINFTKNQILFSSYLAQQAKNKVTDKDLKEAYEKQLAAMKNERIHNLSVIVVETEGKARDLLEKIKSAPIKDKGNLFLRLVKEHSKEPESARQGGSLYPMTGMQLTQLFGKGNYERIARLKGNAFADQPFKVGNLYFIIRVDSVKDFSSEAKPYEQVKDQVNLLLTSQVEKAKKTELVADLIASDGFGLKVPGTQDDYKSFKDLPSLLQLLSM